VAVLCRTDEGHKAPHRNMTAFLIEKEPGFGANPTVPGLTVPGKIEKMGYKGVDTTELVLQDVRVPASRVLGGVLFSLGLTIVLVGGAELFTGNNLIVMAWASRRISAAALLRNWAIVYLGNLVGAVGLVIMVFLSHHLDMNNGRIGLVMLTTAVGKISSPVATLFFKGVLCNLLVCLAVWQAQAGRSVADKILGLMLPISAFVAAGFEHSVANMYFLPMALLLRATGNVPAGFDASPITAGGVIYNLIVVTLGNIAGGAGLVGFVYWAIYRKGLAPSAVK